MLAWRILVHDRKRFIWSVLGISFAVLLMFVEMGFYHGSYDSVTLPIQALDADLILFNRMKEDLFPIEPFPRARLAQARGTEGVASVYPLYTFLDAIWKSTGGTEHPIRVLAFDPSHRVWNLPEVDAARDLLRRPDTCLVDSASRDRYGTPTAGTVAELDGRRIRVIGSFTLGPDLVVDGTALMSDVNFERYFSARGATLEDVDLGILRTEEGADPRDVAAALARALPDDVIVATPQETIDRVHAYWRRNQPVGAVFLTGLVVGFVIGVAICYQVLFTEITDNLPQFATLKAIGYGDRFLVVCVLRQALYLAAIGFAFGAACAAGSYSLLEGLASLPIGFRVERVLLVLAASVAMCLAAAVIAIRKVLRSDPAEVF